MKEEFYTKKRWLNWINKVKESKFKLTENEDDKAGAIFVYIMDDVVLACLKIIARCEREVIPPEEAMTEIEKIKEIVFEKQDSLGEDADMMFESLKSSLAVVFVSCQRYIAGEFDKATPLNLMIKNALDAENKEKVDDAFDVLSQVGARVIAGEVLPEEAVSELPYSMSAELLDGIDAISAAMIGDDSYKEDDGTDEGGDEL